MNKQLWKKAGLRALIGAPVGLAICTVIAVLDSWYMGDGKFYAVVPALTADIGSEIGAVTVQMLCSMLCGAAFAGASVIYQTDWSLTRMTAVHFLICSAATFPIAYLLRWMDHSAGGILKYFGQFLAIYVVIWVASYVRLRRYVNALNKKVNHLA